MNKTLACADLVPGCPQVITAPTEDEVVAEAGRHAEEEHGMKITPELVEQVRAHIQLVPEPSQSGASSTNA